jgi:hypothetical protein
MGFRRELLAAKRIRTADDSTHLQFTGKKEP